MQKLGLRVPEPHPKGSEKEYNGIFRFAQLLWSRNFATMVTWCHTSPLYYCIAYLSLVLAWKASMHVASVCAHEEGLGKAKS